MSNGSPTGLRSAWADSVDPDLPLPEYPRPQLRRPRWHNLNGPWQLAVAPRELGRPSRFEHTILVPFPVESILSGVTRAVLPEERAWYRRQFSMPSCNPGERWLLHFGAVDWEAEVWLNGHALGVHRGGFDPFSFDITDALESVGEQELVV
ncbi:glycoside hydrolase family 2, partial [Myxococcota bacterium]|nr:glycoside hydrolase family 2 [Myxococcota bacterium]